MVTNFQPPTEPRFLKNQLIQALISQKSNNLLRTFLFLLRVI